MAVITNGASLQKKFITFDDLLVISSYYLLPMAIWTCIQHKTGYRGFPNSLILSLTEYFSGNYNNIF